MRQEASLQRVKHNLEDETESLKEEMSVSQGIVKKHTEFLGEQHNTLFFRMLHDVSSVIHWKRSTWKLRTPGGMSEVCRREYDRSKSDLLDEHDKWFCNLRSDQKPEDYPEWYNSWMDTKHWLYVRYVAGILMHPNLISLRLMLNPLPASLKAWCESKGKTIPLWGSLILLVSWVKKKLLPLRHRQNVIMGDIQSLSCGLTLFHMMKTTYIYDKPENRNSWIADFTIWSVDKEASDDDKQSTPRMRVRTHI
jgi:hypothetical protein